LTQVPYGEVTHPNIVLPERIHDPAYRRDNIPEEMFVPKRY
jgi:polyphosphate kinase